MHKKLLMAVMTATLFNSSLAFAEGEIESIQQQLDAFKKEEGTPLVLEEIVVTAAPLNRSADDLTQPAVVLTGKDLLLKAEASIGETLANELGVSSTYFGPVAGRPVIRGQAGPRVSVLESGISALDVSDISPDHAVSIEPLFAERIEILRGPATLLYGSSAAGGVVNVIDNRIPETLPESTITGAFELRGDTAAGERTAVGRMDGGSGIIAWHLDAFQRATEDIGIPGFATADPGVRPDDEVRGTLLNSAGESQGYAGGISLVGARGFIGVSLSRYENDYGLPGPEEEHEEGHEEEPGAEEEPEIAPGPFIELEQTRFDLRSAYAFDSAIETLRFRFGINDYEHVEIEPSGELATQFTNDAWEGRLELVHAPLGNWRGVVGLQVNDRDFSAVGEEAFVPPTRTRSYGLFALEERAFSAGRIELGARIESLEHVPTAGLQGYDETAVSLAAGVVWDFATDYDLSVNLSRSERHPDAAELYANGAHLATGLFEVGLLLESGSRVEQETTTNLDVSVHHHREAVSWQVSVFYNDTADYIFRAQTAEFEDGLPLAPYIQQDAKFYGYEAEIEFPLGPVGSAWDLRLFTDYVRAKTNDTDLPRIQPRRMGAELGYTALRWSAGVEAIYHAEQNDVSSFKTDSFTMLNANVLFRLGEGGAIDWQFFLKATNLLDEDARRSPSFRAEFVPLPGVSLHAGIRASFN